jgi:hypothetical protein
MSALKPLNDGFLFVFYSETAGGQFIEKNKGQIILTNQDLNSQGQFARWAKVIAVGEKVTDFTVNDVVLIESLQWTRGFDYEGRRYWKSDQSKVLAIGADESVTFAY